MNKQHLFLPLLALTVLAGGCFDPDPADQLVLVIDSRVSVPCALDEIEIVIEGSERSVEVVELSSDDDLPLTLTLLPADGVSQFVVSVTGRVGGEDTYSLEGTFNSPSGSKMVPVTFRSACRMGDRCDLSDDVVTFSGDFPVPLVRSECDTEGDAGPDADMDGGVDGDPIDGGDGCEDEVELCNGVDDNCNDIVDEGCSHYEVTEIEDPYRDACQISGFEENILMNGRSAEGTFSDPIPFDFEFYGRPVTEITAGDNGYFSFDNVPMVESTRAQPLDRAAAPSNTVMPFWDELRLRSEGVCVATTGNAPNREQLITYCGACFDTGRPCATADSLTFTVVLEEGTNRIRFLYGDMRAQTPELARGISATIGIRGPDEPRCTADECTSEGLCDDESRAPGLPCGYTEFSSQSASAEPLPNLLFAPAILSEE